MPQKVSGTKVKGRVLQVTHNPADEQEVVDSDVGKDIAQEQRGEHSRLAVKGVGEATGNRAVLALGIVAALGLVTALIYQLMSSS